MEHLQQGEDAPAGLPVRSFLPEANELQLQKDSPHHLRDELYLSMKDTHGDHHKGLSTILAVIIFSKLPNANTQGEQIKHYNQKHKRSHFDLDLLSNLLSNSVLSCFFF